MSLAPLPVRVAFDQPDRLAVTVSPDGQRWACLAPVDGALNVFAGELGAEVKPVTKLRGRGISPPSPVAPSYRWAYDSRHIVYSQDRDGDENWIPHSVDVETGEIRRLIELDGVSCGFLHAVPSRPTEMLFGVNGRDARYHDAHILDVVTGVATRVFVNRRFNQLVGDEDLRIRAGAEIQEDGGCVISVRDDTASPWRPVLTVGSAAASMTTRILRFSDDGATLYVLTSHGADKLRPVAIDTRTGTIQELPGDARYDAHGVAFHPTDGTPQWVEVYRDRRGRILLDDDLGPAFDQLAQLAGGRDVSVASRDLADRRWVVTLTRDDGPSEYHLLDRDTGEHEPLCRQRADLDAYRLGSMEAFTFTARDGIQIEGYLTLPPDTEPADLPAVLLVHGGPTHRDYWGFNPLAQVLATRGYAVVQVNYRGSLGYGQSFVRLGEREWAAAMHTDLLDAVDHVAAAGTVDRDRVAIMGGSYGGYAALVGATFTPTEFRCAASLYGPANLLTLIRSFPPYWGPHLAFWHRRIGNPDTEPEFLWSRSPLSRVADVQRPLLIVQTANDPRVTRAEAEQMVDALKENGIEHEYVLIEGEGHGFTRPESRVTAFEAVTSFIQRHLSDADPAEGA